MTAIVPCGRFPAPQQYQAMAFAQVTYRESLRDIEACLSAQSAKLYHMGFRGPVRRSTLGRRQRDPRLAYLRRVCPATDCAGEAAIRRRQVWDVDLTSTVYALDSTTIDLCLSVFPWAHFRSTKAAVKMHTLLDLRGNIPSFIHISNGKTARCSCARYAASRTWRHLRHGPWICGFRPPASCCISLALSS